MFRRSERPVTAAVLALALVGCGTGDDPSGGAFGSGSGAGGEARESEPARDRGGSGFLARLLSGGDRAGPGSRDAPSGETTGADATDADRDPDGARGNGVFARLFGGGGPRTEGGATLRDVAPGEAPAYGTLGRLCDLPTRRLGQQIGQYPERRPMYRLYDSAPGETAPHAFYVTGFADGCVRQVTAALVMFGAPATHEALRYGLPAETQPFSATDDAYERLKRRVCGTPRGEPCGPRIDRLSRDTVFLSVYERFGDSPTWKNVLLHDGTVLAVDLKSG